MTQFVFRNKKLKRFGSLIALMYSGTCISTIQCYRKINVVTIFLCFLNTDSNVDLFLFFRGAAGSCSSNTNRVNQSLWSNIFFVFTILHLHLHLLSSFSASASPIYIYMSPYPLSNPIEILLLVHKILFIK